MKFLSTSETPETEYLSRVSEAKQSLKAICEEHLNFFSPEKIKEVRVLCGKMDGAFEDLMTAWGRAHFVVQFSEEEERCVKRIAEDKKFSLNEAYELVVTKTAKSLK